MSTSKGPKTTEGQLNADITLLDNLLGVEARKPGRAASLPAAIRIVETLEPAGGKNVPVFPASYAGARDTDPPVYDLAGIEYGEVVKKIQDKGEERFDRPIIRARMCALDSAQGQANRTEIAFVEADDLITLVPQAQATLPRRGATTSRDNLLTLPHRIADFRVRLSNQENAVKTAITSFADGDALPLIRLMPTSLVFGFWDSRAKDYQHKHARILLSRIDAFDVVPCQRHAVYNGPYSQTEFAEAILNDSARSKQKADTEKMSGEGFTNALGTALGGVLVSGQIERLSLISLTDIARINCLTQPEGDVASKIDPELTNAARRYIFALAALAEGHPRANGSHRLRSGCELIQESIQFSTRGSALQDEDAANLKEMHFDRQRLIAIASDAMAKLSVPATLEDFVVTAEKLSETFTSLDDVMKEANKAAKDARKKANATKLKADELDQKAVTSGKPADRAKADAKKAEAAELELKAIEAEARTNSSATQPTTTPEAASES